MWPRRRGTRWTFEQAWAAFRDVASWVLGAYWGHLEMTAPRAGDPSKLALVAALLAVPFAARADEIRMRYRNRRPPDGVSENGIDPDAERESARP